MRKRRVMLDELTIQVYDDGSIEWNGLDKFLWEHLHQPAIFLAKRCLANKMRRLARRQRKLLNSNN